MRRNSLLLAAALILLSNAMVLLGVARNRAGQPLRTVQLSERELPLNYRGQEDSGVSMRLAWDQYSLAGYDPYSWLDRAKLQSLGFDCDAALRNPAHPPLPRPAFLVLEYNGPAWEAWQKFAEQKADPRFSAAARSRLFVIDAATTPEPLLPKYTDTRKYLLVRGVVRLNVSNWDMTTQKTGPYHLQPSVSALLPKDIHVPLPFSKMLADRSSGTAASEFHYTVTLSFGSRFEPWVAAVQ